MPLSFCFLEWLSEDMLVAKQSGTEKYLIEERSNYGLFKKISRGYMLFITGRCQ